MEKTHLIWTKNVEKEMLKLALLKLAKTVIFFISSRDVTTSEQRVSHILSIALVALFTLKKFVFQFGLVLKPLSKRA